MDELLKIEAVMEYAQDHPSFDAEFIENLSEYYERKGYLTSGQMDALDRIVEQFRITY